MNKDKMRGNWRKISVKDDLSKTKISEIMADMIDDHILVCDARGRVVFSNKAMQSRLGYADAEIKQKRFFQLVADDYKMKAASFLESAKEEPSGFAELLLHGRQADSRLHFRLFKRNGLFFMYGNENLAEYERIRKKLDVEIANAIKIHKRSLPESLPDTKGISFSSLYIPAEELGGDLFDAFKVNNGLLDDYFEQYVCFIADVSGHGLDSAMLAVFVQDTIRSYFRLKHVPGQVLSPKEIMHFFIEEYVKEGFPDEYLVCLFLVVFDLKTNELTYSNAGFHKSPLLFADRGNIIELNHAGLPVSTAFDAGMMKYEDTSLHLSPASVLFLMSDGLPEQRAGNAFYENRMRKLLAEIYPLDSEQIMQKVHGDFTGFLGYEKIKDDITLVVAKLHGTDNG